MVHAMSPARCHVGEGLCQSASQREGSPKTAQVNARMATADHDRHIRWPVGAVPTSNFTHRNFSTPNLTFLQCKSHISPVQISHFSSANLTFPVQISNPAFQISRLSNAHLKNFILSMQVAGVSIEFLCQASYVELRSCAQADMSGSEDDESN